jgi:thiamine pyrophosphokinase
MLPTPLKWAVSRKSSYARSDTLPAVEASIIANGTVKSGAWLRRNIIGIVIAADGGANTCLRNRIVPDYVIGDFDSVKKSTLASLKRSAKVLHEPDQNKTDLQKALALARRIGAGRVFVFGAIGSELDHTLANIFTLDARCVMKDEHHEIRVVERRLDLAGKRGDLVSVIALTSVRGLSYAGLTWSVSNRSVPAGWIGIRNRFAGKKARITLTKGKIAVIRLNP